MEEINWISLVLASITPMAIGFVYYHPRLFGNAWMKTLGITEEDIAKSNPAIKFGLALLMSFLLSFFLLNFNNSTGQEGEFDNFGHGAWHGAFIGFFVAMPVLVTNGLFELRGLKNAGINVLYWMITLALMGGIVDAMNHWPN